MGKNTSYKRMEKQIIGDQGKRKRRYDPDLARKVNEAVERERKQAERKSKLEAEVESTEPKIQPATPADLEAICKGYEEFMSWEERGGKIPTEITNKLNPTKEQVLGFSRKLVDYTELDKFKYFTANYLAALMHSSKDDEFVLDLTELSNQGILLSCLGYKLENKKLTINGNVGEDVGYYAKNSKITINGNAGNCVGLDAKNSEITINGNAGGSVGLDAKNSEIYIKGTFENLSSSIGKGTEIFQEENGKWIQVYPETK